MSNVKSLLLSLLLIAVVSFTLSAQDAMKDYSETFDVGEGITLSSDVKYSNVEVLIWDKDVVDILAEVKVDASSQNKAKEKLSKIDVKIGKSGNTISLETSLEEGWSRNARVDIHVVVKAPAYLNMDMESAYGDLFIQELNGLLLLDLKYGNLKTGKLSRGNEKPYNKVEMSYSNGTIESAGWMELELAYSDLDLAVSKMLFVEGKYSKLIGEKTGGIVAEGAYDKYYMDEVDNFVGELRYSGIKFGTLNKKLDVVSKYTPIKVENISKEFKTVNVSSSYGNIHLGVDAAASFKLESEARYGYINCEREGKLSKSKETNIVKVWGNVGSSPKGSITLEARYGNIVIE